ncbi:MAG: hypothetical protein ACRD68_05310 [Pyrinomonadaceae bacterium]
MSTRFVNRRAALVCLAAVSCVLTLSADAFAQRRASGGTYRAVVVDERLAALRDAPGLSAPLVQRMRRGRAVTVLNSTRARDGVAFHRVAVTRRTRGWLQSEALASPARAGDDERLLRLVRASEDFDRLARAQIFLEWFPKSALRPAALMLYGAAAEASAARLSRDAARRLDAREIEAGGAPAFTYFMNYNGLDRFNRAGVTFVYDRAARRFHYDGASWREILRRHPRSPEAAEARRRLETLTVVSEN